MKSQSNSSKKPPNQEQPSQASQQPQRQQDLTDLLKALRPQRSSKPLLALLQLPSESGRLKVEDFARFAHDLSGNVESWNAIMGLDSDQESLIKDWLAALTEEALNPEGTIDKQMVAVAAAVLRQFTDILKQLVKIHLRGVEGGDE